MCLCTTSSRECRSVIEYLYAVSVNDAGRHRPQRTSCESRKASATAYSGSARAFFVTKPTYRLTLPRHVRYRNTPPAGSLLAVGLLQVCRAQHVAPPLLPRRQHAPPGGRRHARPIPRGARACPAAGPHEFIPAETCSVQASTTPPLVACALQASRPEGLRLRACRRTAPGPGKRQEQRRRGPLERAARTCASRGTCTPWTSCCSPLSGPAAAAAPARASA